MIKILGLGSCLQSKVKISWHRYPKTALIAIDTLGGSLVIASRESSEDFNNNTTN